jgi:hypothetical protein
MPNPTQIVPPRVPFIDTRTGTISREWYRFFLHLFDVTGGGSGSVTIPDLQAAPLFQKQVEYPDTTPPSRHVTVKVDTTPMPNMGGLWAALNAVQASVPTTSAPVTKTADFTVAFTDQWLINNKAGSTCTVTLPSASDSIGRVLYLLNYQAQTVVSASSNVVPVTGGAAGTAILAATAGKWATLVSNGTNWVITQSN